MLSIYDRPERHGKNINRRELLQVGGLGALGLSLLPYSRNKRPHRPTISAAVLLDAPRT